MNTICRGESWTSALLAYRRRRFRVVGIGSYRLSEKPLGGDGNIDVLGRSIGQVKTIYLQDF